MLGIFLDIETTGLDSTRHNVIDIAFKVVDLSTNEIKKMYQSIVKLSAEQWTKSDPNSLKITNATFDELKNGRSIADVRKDILEILCELKIQRGNAVFICQNPAFDRSFFNQIIEVYKQEELNWPYHWLDLASMYWAMCVVHAQAENRAIPEKIFLSKNDIAKKYHLPEEGHPHRAMRGVEHLMDCYRAVLKIDGGCNV